MGEKKTTSVNLDVENYEYLQRETNNTSAFINDLIEAHRQGKSDMNEAIARHRKEQLESELRQIQSKEASIQSEIKSIESTLSTKEQRREEKLAEARDTLKDVPKDPDNRAIKNWADKVDLTPEELLEEL